MRWFSNDPASVAFRQQRAAGFERALARHGLRGEPTDGPPEELPAFGLPAVLPLRWLVGVCAEGADARWYLADAEISGLRRAAGWNVEIVGSGDSPRVTWRHTLALVHQPGAARAAFQIVPDVGALIGDRVDERAQVEPMIAQSRLAQSFLRRFTRMGERLQAFEERGESIELPERRGLAGRYRVTGEDPDALVRLVDDAVAARLCRRPGAIVAADGAWLLVSRNVAPAFRQEETPELPYGLLTEDQVEEQVEATLELLAVLSSG
jgi:hypothetical protein